MKSERGGVKGDGVIRIIFQTYLVHIDWATRVLFDSLIVCCQYSPSGVLLTKVWSAPITMKEMNKQLCRN